MQTDDLTPRIVRSAGPISHSVFGNAFWLGAYDVLGRSGRETVLSFHLGALRFDSPMLVRIQSACRTGEVFEATDCDCRWQLRESVRLITERGEGILIYMADQEGRGVGLFDKIRSFEFTRQGLSTFDAFTKLGLPIDSRDYAPGCAVLHRLGVRSVDLLTGNDAKVRAASAFGLSVNSVTPLSVDKRGPMIQAQPAAAWNI